MSGYLQRLALNVLETRGSIHPVLDSFFSRTKSANQPGAHSLETARSDVASAPSPLVPQAPPASLEAHKIPHVPDPRSELENQEWSEPILNPIPSPKQASAKKNPLILHSLPGESLHERQEDRLCGPRHESTVGSPEPKSLELQIPTTAHSELAELVNKSTSGAKNWAPLVSVPNTSERAETPIIPRLDRPSNHRNRSEALKRPETSTSTVPETDPGSDQIEARTSTPNEGEAGDAAQGRSARSKQNSRKLVVPRPVPLRFGADGTEKTGFSNLRKTRGEPDEIQIHIGRIEVIAVPPAPPAPLSPKRKHEAPSLNEYLQRRNGRSV